MSPPPPETAAALSLLSAAAVRSRAHQMLDAGLSDRLPYFRIQPDRLKLAANLVIRTTKAAYPSLEVPFHSRWRHFVFDGEDRWASLDAATKWDDEAARARAAFDLAIVSVLLDAGAGSAWAYRDPHSGQWVGRSEGLALASLEMFSQGAFSSDAADPLRADAEALARLSDETLARGFQVSAENPLLGLAARGDLLRKLGKSVIAATNVFGQKDRPRPGGLFDVLAERADGAGVEASQLLSEVLRRFGSIWPSRLSLGGVPLGDCWHHSAIKTGDSTDGLIPLHKLSQWMTYSLIEPIRGAGIDVTNIDGLTGLAEYRNGGLFVDTGVLEFRNVAEFDRAHDVSSALVTEWRALTVALLDRLASMIRERLGFDRVSFPLAKLLEGGTWAAGRKIARERRPDGSPPVRVISDGTVF